MPKPLWDEWLGRKIAWRLQSRILPHLRRNQEIWGETIREYLTHPVRWMDAGCGWHLLRKDLEQLENELLNLAGIVVASILISPTCASTSISPGVSAHHWTRSSFPTPASI